MWGLKCLLDAHMLKTWLPAFGTAEGSGAFESMGRGEGSGGMLLRKTSGPSTFLSLYLLPGCQEVGDIVPVLPLTTGSASSQQLPPQKNSHLTVD